MFKFKRALLAQVFTVFLSSQVWGGGAGALELFNKAYINGDYDRANQLSEEAFHALRPEQEIQDLIKNNPGHEHVDEMMTYLRRASILAVRSQNTEKILMCMYRLNCFNLLQNLFHNVELAKALGIHEELLKLMRKKIEIDARGVDAEFKRKVQGLLSILTGTVNSTNPSIQTAQRNLEFINGYINGFHDDPSKKREIFLIDLNWLSGALNLSLFTYYCEGKNSMAYDVFENVMEFINCREPTVKEHTIEKMARVVVAQNLYTRPFPGISDEDYELLKQAVDKVPVRKGTKKILARELTPEQQKAAYEAANRIREELLKEEAKEEQTQKNKDKKQKKSKGTGKSSAVHLKVSGDTQTTKVLSPSESNEENLKGPFLKEEEASQIEFFDYTPSKEDVLLAALLDEQNRSEQLEKKLKNMEKMLAQANEKKRLLAEENERLKQEITKREEDKLKGSERGKRRMTELFLAKKELERKTQELEKLKQSSEEYISVQDPQMVEDYQRLKTLEGMFHNIAQQYQVSLQEAFIQGQNYSISYFQLTQAQALKGEFEMGEHTSPSQMPGVLLQSGEWVPIVNGGFYIGELWYPLQNNNN